MSRQALVTMAAFAASMEMPSGLQRRHGRKPAASAAPTLSCSRTFFGFARRDGHDGLQKTPVVATEYQKRAVSGLVARDDARPARVLGDVC